MKSIFIAAPLATATSSIGYASPYGSAYGIVESVREVRLSDEPPGFPSVFEHFFRPQTGDELLAALRGAARRRNGCWHCAGRY